MRNFKSIFVAAAIAVGTIAATSAITAPAEAHGFGFGHHFGGWGHHFHWGHGFGGIYIGGGDDDDGYCYVKAYYDEDGYKHFYKVCS